MHALHFVGRRGVEGETMRPNGRDNRESVMGVIRRKKQDGTYLPFWYGLWTENGRRECRSLNRWEGTPPKDGEARGDAAFERSREAAEMALARIRGGEDEGLGRIRWTVQGQIERWAGDAGKLQKLAILLAEMQIKTLSAMKSSPPPPPNAEAPALVGGLFSE